MKNDEAKHPTVSPRKIYYHVDQHENEPDGPVCYFIMFSRYSIDEELKGQVGRPPKHLLKKSEELPKEEYGTFFGNNLFPSMDPKKIK